MQHFIEFLIHYNEPIIMWLFVIFLSLSVGYLIYNIFFRKVSSAIPGDAKDIEELLKKVLAQANSIGAVGATGAPVNIESLNRDVDLKNVANSSESDVVSKPGDSAKAGDNGSEELQKQLGEKETEIVKLRAEVAKMAGNKGGNKDLSKKIEELEARLAEYEIIEDDIADLSKYKDENAKLRDELELLKSGGTSGEADATNESSNSDSSDVAEEVSEPVTESVEGGSGDAITDDLISEFEQAVNESTGVSTEQVLASEVGEEVEVLDPDSIEATKDLVEESENEPVEESLPEPESVEEAITEPQIEEPSAPQVTPEAVPAETSADVSVEADDIMGEFTPSDAAEVEPESDMAKEATPANEGEKAAAEQAAVDTERMMAEMAALSEVPQEEDGASALDQELDIEKMAGEASGLTGDKN